MVKKYLHRLYRRFPNLEPSIRRLHEADAEFRSICEEMEMAETARDHWLDMPERAAEYEEILNELRTDFWKCLTPGEGREPAQGEAALDGEDQGERL